jgi:hypothetical protein
MNVKIFLTAAMCIATVLASAQVGWRPVTGTSNSMSDGLITPAQQVIGAKKSTTCKIMQVASADVDGVRLLVGVYHGNLNHGELLLPNPVRVKFSIELEDGSIHPVTFRGLKYKVLKPTRAECWAITDTIKDSRTGQLLTLTRGQRFWTRSTQIVANTTDKVAGGLRSLSNVNSDNYPEMKEGCAPGDLAFGGEIPLSGEIEAFAPIAVLGHGDHKAVAVIGDSIFAGYGDTGNRQGLSGMAVRAVTGQFKSAFDPSITPTFGLLQLAKSGESLHDQMSDDTFGVRNDILLASGVKTVLTDAGNIDVHGNNLAEVQEAILSFARKYTDHGLRMIWCPLLPRTLTTDGWLTLEGQTPDKAAARRGLRSWMVTGGLESDCINAGISKQLIRVSNMPRAISCDKFGFKQPLGEYVIPELNGGTPRTVCTVNSDRELSDYSFRDTMHLTPAGGVQPNFYRGYTRMLVQSNEPDNLNLWLPSGIRYVSEKGTCLGSQMPQSFQIGDVINIYETMFENTAHPSSTGARLMAKAFNPAMVK